MSMDDSQE